MYLQFGFNDCHKVGRANLTGIPRFPATRLVHGQTSKLSAAVPFAAALRTLKRRVRIRCNHEQTPTSISKPRWLGGGLQEIISTQEVVIVAGKGTIYGEKVFPWAQDCLEELKSAGLQVILLEEPESGPVSLDAVGLQKGVHYDLTLEVEPEDIEQILCESEYPEEKTLVVGDSVSLMKAANCTGFSSAFICSGRMSQTFQMSQAPTIDVPANGGHFSEPEDVAWDETFPLDALPDYGLACFAFSDPRLTLLLNDVPFWISESYS